MTQRLLIISCSNRKYKFDYPVKAWHLYDGVLYRSLKRIQHEGHWPEDLQLLILSAEYGLVSPETELSYYDKCMTLQRAKELCPSVQREMDRVLMQNEWSEIVLSMGDVYFRVLAEFNWPKPPGVGVIPGRIGEKIKLTKLWVLDPYKAKRYIHWLNM